MKKTLKNYEIAALKRTAANMDKIQTELNKKLAKKAELDAEIEALNTSLANMEQPYMHITGGRHIMDLVHKEVTPLFNEGGTPKMDKNGKYQQKATKWVYTAPTEEDIIPEGAAMGIVTSEEAQSAEETTEESFEETSF